MVANGVVWCYQDNQLVPMQLSSVKLHGLLTEKQLTAVNDFLNLCAKKHVILKKDFCDNEIPIANSNDLRTLLIKPDEFIILSDENNNGTIADGESTNLLSLMITDNNCDNVDEFVSAISQTGLDKKCRKLSLPVESKMSTEIKTNKVGRFTVVENCSDPFSNNIEHEKIEKQRKISAQTDEIVRYLLQKYNKNGQDSKIPLKSIEENQQKSDDKDVVIEKKPVDKPKKRVRKNNIFREPSATIYENCLNLSKLDFEIEDKQQPVATETFLKNQKTDRILKWLKHEEDQKRSFALDDVSLSSSTVTSNSSRKSSASSYREMRKISSCSKSTSFSSNRSLPNSDNDSGIAVSRNNTSSCSECELVSMTPSYRHSRSFSGYLQKLFKKHIVSTSSNKESNAELVDGHDHAIISQADDLLIKP